eukprot:TRINITY_DN6167_c0_g1_i1.p1 TRINITY_DN6167_c0_g1~~TRINITY_DN6167_c0_g1_i1.p1  ORF type:complete len:1628 (+),score=424.51 TRINITY_DN6167_c0_g1_i1:106-4989(+)
MSELLPKPFVRKYRKAWTTLADRRRKNMKFIKIVPLLDEIALMVEQSLHYAPDTSVFQTEELFDLMRYLFSLPLNTPEYADGVRCTVALIQSSAQVFATISDSLVEDLAISLLEALHSFPAASIDHVLSIYLSIMQTVAKRLMPELINPVLLSALPFFLENPAAIEQLLLSLIEMKDDLYSNLLQIISNGPVELRLATSSALLFLHSPENEFRCEKNSFLLPSPWASSEVLKAIVAMLMDDGPEVKENGLRMLVGLCEPRGDTNEKDLGIVLCAALTCLDSSEIFDEASFSEWRERWKTTYLTEWLKKIYVFNFNVFCQSLLPHPPSHMRILPYYSMEGEEKVRLDEIRSRRRYMLLCRLLHVMESKEFRRAVDLVLPYWLEDLGVFGMQDQPKVEKFQVFEEMETSSKVLKFVTVSDNKKHQKTIFDALRSVFEANQKFHAEFSDKRTEFDVLRCQFERSLAEECRSVIERTSETNVLTVLEKTPKLLNEYAGYISSVHRGLYWIRLLHKCGVEVPYSVLRHTLSRYNPLLYTNTAIEILLDAPCGQSGGIDWGEVLEFLASYHREWSGHMELSAKKAETFKEFVKLYCAVVRKRFDVDGIEEEQPFGSSYGTGDSMMTPAPATEVAGTPGGPSGSGGEGMEAGAHSESRASVRLSRSQMSPLVVGHVEDARIHVKHTDPFFLRLLHFVDDPLPTVSIEGIKMMHFLLCKSTKLNDANLLLQKSLPILTKPLWSRLGPSHIEVAKEISSLLVKGASIDRQFLEACIVQSFESDDPEERMSMISRGMELLEAVNENDPPVEHITRVFMYLIQMTNDSREFVRTNARISIQMLSTRNLGNVFRAVEKTLLFLYYPEGGDPEQERRNLFLERTQFLKNLILFHQIRGPDASLSWDTVLELFHLVDFDQYLRLGTFAFLKYNLKGMLLLLSLEMLTCGCPCDDATLSALLEVFRESTILDTEDSMLHFHGHIKAFLDGITELLKKNPEMGQRFVDFLLEFGNHWMSVRKSGTDRFPLSFEFFRSFERLLHIFVRQEHEVLSTGYDQQHFSGIDTLIEHHLDWIIANSTPFSKTHANELVMCASVLNAIVELSPNIMIRHFFRYLAHIVESYEFFHHLKETEVKSELKRMLFTGFRVFSHSGVFVTLFMLTLKESKKTLVFDLIQEVFPNDEEKFCAVDDVLDNIYIMEHSEEESAQILQNLLTMLADMKLLKLPFDRIGKISSFCKAGLQRPAWKSGVYANQVLLFGAQVMESNAEYYRSNAVLQKDSQATIKTSSDSMFLLSISPTHIARFCAVHLRVFPNEKGTVSKNLAMQFKNTLQTMSKKHGSSASASTGDSSILVPFFELCMQDLESIEKDIAGGAEYNMRSYITDFAAVFLPLVPPVFMQESSNQHLCLSCANYVVKQCLMVPKHWSLFIPTEDAASKLVLLKRIETLHALTWILLATKVSCSASEALSISAIVAGAARFLSDEATSSSKWTPNHDVLVNLVFLAGKAILLYSSRIHDSSMPDQTLLLWSMVWPSLHSLILPEISSLPSQRRVWTLLLDLLNFTGYLHLPTKFFYSSEWTHSLLSLKDVLDPIADQRMLESINSVLLLLTDVRSSSERDYMASHDNLVQCAIAFRTFDQGVLV